MIHHYFGANIRALRKARGWSQKDLALKLGKKVSAISSYETDGKAPTLETALLMAELFGVSVDELIYGQDAEFLSIRHLSQNQKDELYEREREDETIFTREENCCSECHICSYVFCFAADSWGDRHEL